MEALKLGWIGLGNMESDGGKELVKKQAMSSRI
jgi:hypothetical protein